MIMGVSSANQSSGRWSRSADNQVSSPRGSQEVCVNRIGQLRRVLLAGVTFMAIGGVAFARQTTDLLVAETVLTPGSAVVATVVGPPGNYFVVLGSSVGA